MPRAMRFLVRLSWGVSLLAGTAAIAQVSVSIPAVVVDKSGQPVHGLQKADFELRAGKNVSFDSVEEVPPLNFSGFADPVPVFILYDAISIHPLAQTKVSQWLLEYLRTAADEHLAVTVLLNTAGGIHVIHDMSTDSRVFAAAMDRVFPKAGQPQASSASTGAADDFTKAVNVETAQLQELTKSVPPIEMHDYMALMSRQLDSYYILTFQTQPAHKATWIDNTIKVNKPDTEITVANGFFSIPQ